MDTLFYWTDIRAPNWNFKKLRDNLQAFEVLIEIHYRYYQFYANTFVAATFFVVLRSVNSGIAVGEWMAFVAFQFILLLGARDTFRKYHSRVNDFLGRPGGRA